MPRLQQQFRPKTPHKSWVFHREFYQLIWAWPARGKRSTKKARLFPKSEKLDKSPQQGSNRTLVKTPKPQLSNHHRCTKSFLLSLLLLSLLLLSLLLLRSNLHANLHNLHGIGSNHLLPVFLPSCSIRKYLTKTSTCSSNHSIANRQFILTFTSPLTKVFANLVIYCQLLFSMFSWEASYLYGLFWRNPQEVGRESSVKSSGAIFKNNLFKAIYTNILVIPFSPNLPILVNEIASSHALIL